MRNILSRSDLLIKKERLKKKHKLPKEVIELFEEYEAMCDRGFNSIRVLGEKEGLYNISVAMRKHMNGQLIKK